MVGARGGEALDAARPLAAARVDAGDEARGVGGGAEARAGGRGGGDLHGALPKGRVRHLDADRAVPGFRPRPVELPEPRPWRRAMHTRRGRGVGALGLIALLAAPPSRPEQVGQHAHEEGRTAHPKHPGEARADDARGGGRRRVGRRRRGRQRGRRRQRRYRR
jgi:hypothetical protein